MTPSPSSHRPITLNRRGTVHRREQLVVLAEGEILQLAPSASGTRSSSRTTRQPDLAAMCARRRRSRRKRRAARGRARRAPFPRAAGAADGRTHPAGTRRRRAERTGNDEVVAGRAPARPGTRSERPRAVTLQYTCWARSCRRRAPDARLAHPLVELDDILDSRLAGAAERDDKRLRLGARRGEVAEVRPPPRGSRGRATTASRAGSGRPRRARPA